MRRDQVCPSSNKLSFGGDNKQIVHNNGDLKENYQNITRQDFEHLHRPSRCHSQQHKRN